MILDPETAQIIGWLLAILALGALMIVVVTIFLNR